MLVRWQQSEQAVAVVGTIFKYPLGSVQEPHHTDITTVNTQVSMIFWVD